MDMYENLPYEEMQKLYENEQKESTIDFSKLQNDLNKDIFASTVVSSEAVEYTAPSLPTTTHTTTAYSYGADSAAYPEGYVPQKRAEKRKAKLIYSKAPEPLEPQEQKSVSNTLRSAGGEVWVDESLKDWDPNDFRLFCGDLGPEVGDTNLARAFAKYSSFQKAKVVRDKKTLRSKGYGFVSFRDAKDSILALREMNGKYIGSRPVKLRKSTWNERSATSTTSSSTISVDDSNISKKLKTIK